MCIGHRKKIRKLTFRALDLRSGEGLTLETSAFEFFVHFMQLTKSKIVFHQNTFKKKTLLSKFLQIKSSLQQSEGSQGR